MQLVRELRQKAQQFRQLASVPTTGGREADRVLLELADRFEHEAQSGSGGCYVNAPIRMRTDRLCRWSQAVEAGNQGIYIRLRYTVFENCAMYTVEIRRQCEGVAAPMQQMRNWLDNNRTEAANIELSFLPGKVVRFRLSFAQQQDATAFAQAFDGQVMGEADANDVAA